MRLRSRKLSQDVELGGWGVKGGVSFEGGTYGGLAQRWEQGWGTMRLGIAYVHAYKIF